MRHHNGGVQRGKIQSSNRFFVITSFRFNNSRTFKKEGKNHVSKNEIWKLSKKFK